MRIESYVEIEGEHHYVISKKAKSFSLSILKDGEVKLHIARRGAWGELTRNQRVQHGNSLTAFVKARHK